MSINASIACVLVVGSKLKGVKGRAFYVQHWLVREYAKLVGNHLQIWSGSFTGRGWGVLAF